MLEILYLDDHLAAVIKPAGLLVHRTGLDAGETRFALQMLRDQLGRPVWPVHRLDKGTSGVLLFALDAGTARLLGPQFESGGGIRKTYLAMVRGWPLQEGLIDHPLKRMLDDLPGSQRRSACRLEGGAPTQPADGRAERQTAQSATTAWRSLARYELPLAHGAFERTRAALMELRPLTGRRHQLRRHMKHIAHPIIGDATHGKGPLNRAVVEFFEEQARQVATEWAEPQGFQRLWLHALELRLQHPLTGASLSLHAPIDGRWAVWDAYRVGLAGPEVAA